MPFVEEAGQIVSFAEFQDVVNKDQRLFEANEGLSDDIIEAQLQRATERILTRLRSTEWWRSYYIRRDTDNISFNTIADVPPVEANRIKARQSDFTDLCVFNALSDLILPSVADFGNDNNAERQKMGYYKQKGEELFGELITAGDWYDFDNDGTIQSGEKSPGQFNLKRVR